MRLHITGGFMYKISNATIDMFCNYLKEQERSASTIHKYIHDITLLREYADTKSSPAEVSTPC